MTLDDLDIIWMEDGLPLFYADRDDIFDVVESFGFNIYYVLSNKILKPTTSNNNNSKNTSSPSSPPPAPKTEFAIFKVVNNFVGRSVAPATPSFVNTEFLSVEESCVYNMPLIPHVLIDKLDQFFRLVDAQHGTESIVMLTYDTDKEGPEGWGILVPDQNNTSVHCNYDPDSIAQIKPDNVMIVGSVHSHPGMAAYASGTDHADQADFDGIHITFGWQKSVNNNATQYYIELQMAGQAYTLKPEQVFEDFYVEKSPDPDVVEWTSKVKKALPPTSGGSTPSTLGTPPQAPQKESTPPGIRYSSFLNNGYIQYPKSVMDIIDDAAIDKDSIIVFEAHLDQDVKGSYVCPACNSYVPTSIILIDNSCDVCDIPLCEPDQTADQIVYDTIKYCSSRNIALDHSLYLFTFDNSNAPMFLRLTPTTLQEYEDPTYSSSSSPEPAYHEITICCNKRYHHCTCKIRVMQPDVIEFDSFMGKDNVYSNGSKCEGCYHYYDSSCPLYSAVVLDYFNNKTARKPIDYDNTINGENCSSFRTYDDYSYESTY